MRAWLSILITSQYSEVSKICSNKPLRLTHSGIAQCYTTWWMQGALWGYKMAQEMSVKLWKSYIVRREKEGVASASESNSIHNPIWKQSANNLSSDRHIYAIVLISFYTYVWLCKTIIFTFLQLCTLDTFFRQIK